MKTTQGWCYRQGDVILIPLSRAAGLGFAFDMRGRAIPHGPDGLALDRDGAHRIVEGRAELYQAGADLRLEVRSDEALLTHREHAPLRVPKGSYLVAFQRDYLEFGVDGWRVGKHD